MVSFAPQDPLSDLKRSRNARAKLVLDTTLRSKDASDQAVELLDGVDDDDADASDDDQGGGKDASR